MAPPSTRWVTGGWMGAAAGAEGLAAPSRPTCAMAPVPAGAARCCCCRYCSAEPAWVGQGYWALNQRYMRMTSECSGRTHGMKACHRPAWVPTAAQVLLWCRPRSAPCPCTHRHDNEAAAALLRNILSQAPPRVVSPHRRIDQHHSRGWGDGTGGCTCSHHLAVHGGRCFADFDGTRVLQCNTSFA